MSERAFDKIVEGLGEALAVARGEAAPVRFEPNTAPPIKDDLKREPASRLRGRSGRSTTCGLAAE
jgi:hypothetical protein